MNEETTRFNDPSRPGDQMQSIQLHPKGTVIFVVAIVVLVVLMNIIFPRPIPKGDDSRELIRTGLSTRLVSINYGVSRSRFSKSRVDLHFNDPDLRAGVFLTNLEPLDNDKDISWARTWDSVFKLPNSDTLTIIRDLDRHDDPLPVKERYSWLIDTADQDTY